MALPRSHWKTWADKNQRVIESRKGLAKPSRDVFLQCTECGASATGRIVRGVLYANALAAEGDRHVGCGGRLRAFDIGGGR